MARKKETTIQPLSNLDSIRNAPKIELTEKIDLDSLRNENSENIIEENVKKSSKTLDKKDSNVVSYNKEDLFSDENDDFLDERMLSIKNKLKEQELSESVLEDEDKEETEDLEEDDSSVEKEVDIKEDKKETKSDDIESKYKALEQREKELQEKMELLLKYQQEMLKKQEEPKKEEVKTQSKKELKLKEIQDKKSKIRALYERMISGDETVLDELVETQTSLIEIPEEKEEINVDEVVNQKLTYQMQVMREQQIKEKFANENKDLLDNEDYRDFLISKFNKLKDSGVDSTLDGLLKLSAEATRKAFKIEKVNHDTESLKEQESIKQELEKKEKAKKLSVKSTALGVNSEKKSQDENEEESLLDMYRRFRV